MSMQNLLNQFLGTGGSNTNPGDMGNGISGTLNNLAGKIPGGLAGGAAAGGIMALLVSNKSARKFAGTAATYGGAAVLGGLAYKAFQGWRQNRNNSGNINATGQYAVEPAETLSVEFQLTLIKAMIAAAKADGHIDNTEQQRIFDAVQEMNLTAEMKALIFDLLRQPIPIQELANGARNMEQKSELYLASCLVIDPDHPDEMAHLENLARALELPEELPQHLQWQAQQAMSQAS
ncbi:MAG: tellurite resistance TerB family protein [Gammaproteobacteria bacterium]|jgi:uncharacterized membrane protein YebE (DUF533 family)